jgi:ribonuclease BN (tRNA processing enzyme)
MSKVKAWLDMNVQRFISRKFLAWCTATYLVATHSLTSEDWVAVTWGLFSMLSGSNVKNKLFELLFKQRENYEKELQIIKETSEEADKKKTDIFEDHKEELEKIEKEHDVKIEELEKEKREELAATIEENKDKPEKLAEEIAKILNAQFHKKNR